MLEKKITQGEWYVETVTNEKQDFQGRILCNSSERTDSNGKPQVYIIVGDIKNKLSHKNIHCVANAKLIAAAPDLLNSLIYMVENAPKWDKNGEEFDTELANNAIKKAVGSDFVS